MPIQLLEEEEDVEDETLPRTMITLDNGWVAEYDEEEDLWYIYDENGVPLGFIKLQDDVSHIEDLEDITSHLIPFANYEAEEPATPEFSPQTDETQTIDTVIEKQAPKSNPKTSDNVISLILMAVLMAASAAMIIYTKKSTKNKRV